MKSRPLNVAIAGATGAVGIELLDCLEQSSLQVGSLRLFASPRSAGQTLEFGGKQWQVAVADERSFAGTDLVFLATSAELSRELAPRARDAGAFVIDNSSAFRQDADAALVIPEINARRLPREPAIVANPNCSTIIALMAVGPLAAAFGLKRLVASTYQAVSGAGAEGLTELRNAADAHRAGTAFQPHVFSAPIAENLIPWVGAAADAGWTDEELKMLHESRRILEIDDLSVFCTCVRVPVARAHSISLHVTLERPATPAAILEHWQEMPGLQIVADDKAGTDLVPRVVERSPDVHCGRLRQVDEGGCEWMFFVVGDQLLKGAAQNAVQIAELWGNRPD